ncbi:MAG TPA: hypothetical protein VFQ53_20345 [Kofleriaceae bacterium]|nr:hypothetical protein [Kofleriaceae bacterium]
MVRLRDIAWSKWWVLYSACLVAFIAIGNPEPVTFASVAPIVAVLAFGVLRVLEAPPHLRPRPAAAADPSSMAIVLAVAVTAGLATLIVIECWNVGSDDRLRVAISMVVSTGLYFGGLDGIRWRARHRRMRDHLPIATARIRERA